MNIKNHMRVDTVPSLSRDWMVDYRVQKRSASLDGLYVFPNPISRLDVRELHSSETKPIPYLNGSGIQVGCFYIPSSGTAFQAVPLNGLTVQHQKKEAAKALLLSWLAEPEDPEQKASLAVIKQDIDEYRYRKLFHLE